MSPRKAIERESPFLLGGVAIAGCGFTGLCAIHARGGEAYGAAALGWLAVMLFGAMVVGYGIGRIHSLATMPDPSIGSGRLPDTLA